MLRGGGSYRPTPIPHPQNSSPLLLVPLAMHLSSILVSLLPLLSRDSRPCRQPIKFNIKPESNLLFANVLYSVMQSWPQTGVHIHTLIYK